MKPQKELACYRCDYILRGLDANSRCPECGMRVRRSMAAVRLKRWNAVRPPPTAVVESMLGAMIGTIVLAFVLALGATPSADALPYVLTGIGVGFCFTLFYSSVRRSLRRSRWVALVWGTPTLLATALWLLMAIAIISSIDWSQL